MTHSLDAEALKLSLLTESQVVQLLFSCPGSGWFSLETDADVLVSTSIVFFPLIVFSSCILEIENLIHYAACCLCNNYYLFLLLLIRKVKLDQKIHGGDALVANFPTLIPSFKFYFSPKKVQNLTSKLYKQ